MVSELKYSSLLAGKDIITVLMWVEKAQFNSRDGVNLDSPNHKSHMAYPIQNYNSGDCPASHPVHVISLFYEQIFDVGQYALNPNGMATWVRCHIFSE